MIPEVILKKLSSSAGSIATALTSISKALTSINQAQIRKELLDELRQKGDGGAHLVRLTTIDHKGRTRSCYIDPGTVRRVVPRRRSAPKGVNAHIFTGPESNEHNLVAQMEYLTETPDEVRAILTRQVVANEPDSAIDVEAT